MVRAFFVQVRRVGLIETIRQTGLFLQAFGEWLGTQPVTWWEMKKLPHRTIFLHRGGMFRVEEDGDIVPIFFEDRSRDWRGKDKCVVLTPKLAAMVAFAQWRVGGTMKSRWWYTEVRAR